MDKRTALDNISHSLFPKKSNKCGIWGIVNDWIGSYLTKRKQYDNLLSQVFDVTFELSPHGSILCPLSLNLCNDVIAYDLSNL